MSETMPETGSETTQSDDFEPITSQEELDKRIGARLAREHAKFADYPDLKAKAKRLAEMEAASMSDADKASERIKSLESELASERHNNVRRDVAVAKKVPADRISGATREELEASADDLLAFISEQVGKQAPPKPKTPVAGLKSGAASGTDSRMNKKEAAVAALREFRGAAG